MEQAIDKGEYISVMYMDLSKARSSHHRCSIKKGVLKNLTKFTGKTPVPVRKKYLSKALRQ